MHTHSMTFCIYIERLMFLVFLFLPLGSAMRRDLVSKKTGFNLMNRIIITYKPSKNVYKVWKNVCIICIITYYLGIGTCGCVFYNDGQRNLNRHTNRVVLVVLSLYNNNNNNNVKEPRHTAFMRILNSFVI